MYKKIEIQIISFVAILVLALAALASTVSAAQLTSGSLLLSDPRPGVTPASYTFSASGFTTGQALECVDFIFSDDSAGTVFTNIGTTANSATLTSSTALGTAWNVLNPSDGIVRLDQNAGTVNPLLITGNVVFGGIVNPNEGTYYLNVRTYSDSGCTTVVDSIRIAYATKAGEPVSLTIDPTLSFTCTPVGTGVSVNGVNTNIASTASGIDFGNNVTTSTNGISAHSLNVTTNAPGGYTVSIRQSGPFVNGAGDDINPLSGAPNSAPIAFTAAGTEAWGYTTADSSLSAAAVDRFTSGGPNWAGFNTSNEEVMYNDGVTQPINDTVLIGHQAGISSSTPAGTYQTTIIYTVASVY